MDFRIFMFRLLYTLSQALSHCRLSHFILIYFCTFALSRFISDHKLPVTAGAGAGAGVARLSNDK